MSKYSYVKKSTCLHEAVHIVTGLRYGIPITSADVATPEPATSPGLVPHDVVSQTHLALFYITPCFYDKYILKHNELSLHIGSSADVKNFRAVIDAYNLNITELELQARALIADPTFLEAVEHFANLLSERGKIEQPEIEELWKTLKSTWKA